jgi:NAD-dependent deacetylase
MTRTLTVEDLQNASVGRELRDRLLAPGGVLVLTGAGCSADSGLPVFTGPDGLYADPELAALSHADQLPGSLPGLWAFWGGMRPAVVAAQPHAGHTALADWCRSRLSSGAPTTVATQNVDDLLERAGVPDVQHLHGRLDAARCLSCDHRTEGDWEAPAAPPSCPACGAPVRPDMVLFGERPDLDAQYACKRAVRYCELFLAIGTSSVVNTSTGLLRYAGDVGALTVSVDPAPDVDSRYDVHLRGTAATILPLLLGQPVRTT